MSEEQFHIQKSDDGELSVSFTASRAMFAETEERERVNTEETERVGKPTGSTKNSRRDSLDDVPDNERADIFMDSIHRTGSDENLNAGEPASSSTPSSSRVISTCESDTTPLIKNRSSTADSCIGMETEGDNDGSSEASCGCSYHGDKECSHCSSMVNETENQQSLRSLMMPGTIRVPIVGHETMEARSKFTVFKIHVMVENDDVGWFIFRRYSDFVHLNDQLKVLFPNFRLALPPKRWFRSNFDIEFLEERQLGLQAFVDNVTGHRDICSSKPVRDFFCFDDPPGPHDSLEESRAQCECMEEMVYLLRKEVSEKDSELELLKEELELYKNQVQLLTKRLGELNRTGNLERSGSEKTRLSSGDGQHNVSALTGSTEKLITNNLGSVTTQLKNSEINKCDTGSTNDT